MSYPGPPAPSRLSRVLAPVVRAGVDLLYPRMCCGCEAALELEAPVTGVRRWLCGKCEDGLLPVEAPYCRVCGERYEGELSQEFRCMNCGGRRLEFEFALAAYHADGVVRELVHHFKYGRQLHLRGVLATLLLRALQEPRLAAENLAEWVMVPVPLYAAREADRGFNQSAELCGRLSQWTGIPVVQALARVDETDTQAGLDRAQRLRNLRGAFAIRKPWPWQAKAVVGGRKVLLVDDVLTTGATTNECARVLRREGGAEKVVVITVARG